MPRRHLRLAAYGLAAVLATGGGVGVALAATGSADAGLTATFSKDSDWGSGYQGKYTISNRSDAVTKWRVEFDLPSTAKLGTYWNALVTQNGGHVVAVNREYNGSVAKGAATDFGFIVNGSGAPTSCTINGAPCGGGGQPQPTGTGTGNPSPGPSVSPSAPGKPSPTTSTTGQPTPTGPAPQPGNVLVAPYVDMGSWPTPDLVKESSASGVNSFTLAFITGAGCKATWFGAFDPRTAPFKDQINALRAKGGDVKVSFGGANGVEIAQGCADVASTEAEYQAVVDAYQLKFIDLDIEGAAQADKASVDRRSKAIANLQKKRPGLKVSLTLPVLPEGLTADGLSVVKSAKDNGVDVDLVNVMAMDYNRNGDYGDFAVQAAQSTQKQVKQVFGLSDAQAFRKVAVTPMLGQNDDGHIYDQGAARKLVAFANGSHLGMLSFWELTRDRNACNGALFKCTNVPQQAYEFSRIFAGFRG